MTQQEYDKIIKTIRSFMHLDYLSNGACKSVLDTNGLIYVENELKEMIKEK